MAENSNKPELPAWIQGINFLYTRLVLLDFVARIAPGAAAMTATFLFFANGYYRFPEAVSSTHAPSSIWGWLPLVAFMWLVGFALAAFARLVRYAKPEIPAGVQADEWARMLILYDRNASESEKLRSERLYLISEAAAAGGIALLLVATSTFLRPPDLLTDFNRRCLMFAVFIAVTLSLAGVHRDYLARWHRHVRTVVDIDATVHAAPPSGNATIA